MTTSPKSQIDRSRTKLRTAVAKDLDVMRDVVKYLRYQWVGVRSTVFDFDSRDEHGNVKIRARRLNEYPENNPTDWDNLAEWAELLALKASEVATEARLQAKSMRGTSQ